jgi:hypothetical protein
MLVLDKTRIKPPKFPYEKQDKTDYHSIVKTEQVWTDQDFVADEFAIFDKRLTQRLKDNTIAYKFRKNREIYANKMKHVTWCRPTEFY